MAFVSGLPGIGLGRVMWKISRQVPTEHCCMTVLMTMDCGR